MIQQRLFKNEKKVMFKDIIDGYIETLSPFMSPTLKHHYRARIMKFIYKEMEIEGMLTDDIKDWLLDNGLDESML